MGLQLVRPSRSDGDCEVTLTSTSFRFSVAARNLADLHDVHWMRVYVDPIDRLIVFEPKLGKERVPDCFKLGTSNNGYKTLIAKKLIKDQQWIRSVASLGIAERKFELRRYEAEFVGWFIQLMPAFEHAIKPSEITKLTGKEKGIYRYRGGNDGSEIVYIGKGEIKNRFLAEEERKGWGIANVTRTMSIQSSKMTRKHLNGSPIGSRDFEKATMGAYRNSIESVGMGSLKAVDIV